MTQFKQPAQLTNIVCLANDVFVVAYSLSLYAIVNYRGRVM